MGGGAQTGSSGCKAGHPGQDALPPQGCSHTPPRLTFSQPGQTGHAVPPSLHTSGMWEEIGLCGEKTREVWKLHMNGGHGQELIFSPHPLIMKQD